jgi:hypothetical protein
VEGGVRHERASGTCHASRTVTTSGGSPAVLPLTKIVCSNYAFGAASKQNCLRTAYVMSPTNDDIVEFARISGISLIASFAASVYDRTAFAAFFACAGGYALARAFNLARHGH